MSLLEKLLSDDTMCHINPIIQVIGEHFNEKSGDQEQKQIAILAEKIFVAKLGQLPGDVFFDESMIRKIAYQSLKSANDFFEKSENYFRH